MSRAIVLEINEIPPRVLEWWIGRTPSSPLNKLTNDGTFSRTTLDEDLPRDLYPSQSWASVGMGVPWKDHGVFWYGDPKPDDQRFYWQRAADAGRTVGLVGVLHSSPLAEQCSHPNFRFVIPDLFSDESATTPADLEPLQALNLRITRRSARVASAQFSPADLGAIVGFVRNGVRPATFARLGALAGAVATKRVSKERLRVGQAMLMGDVFEHLVNTHDPDLAVLFTNHVASAMHRYWAATFPQDWESHPYGSDWIAAHEDELPFAMRALDDILVRIITLCKRTQRELILVSSMGQRADLDVNTSQTHQAVVRNARSFFSALDCPVEILDFPAAMVPQISVALTDTSSVTAFETWATDRLGTSLADMTTNGNVVTITAHLDCDETTIFIEDDSFTPEQLGASIEKITDHRSGRHDPVGILVSSHKTDWPDNLDALTIADLITSRIEGATQLNRA